MTDFDNFYNALVRWYGHDLVSYDAAIIWYQDYIFEWEEKRTPLHEYAMGLHLEELI